MSRAPEMRKALGKGLTALIPTRAPTVLESDASEIPIERIEPSPLQPRRVFQSDRLEELAQSIRANGIIQPLVVRRHGGGYQLVAGERRWRAAKLAGLQKVPVVIRDVPDEHLLELTLVENIQREELNAVETAYAFERLSKELQLTHEEIGRRTGKDRATITNFLRLLQLPLDIQQLVAERRLSAGHARCLLSLSNPELQRQIASKAVAHGWSVRQVERLTQKVSETREPKQVEELDANVKAAIQEMERALGTKVRIVEKAKQRGRVEIDYYSDADLDRIYNVIIKNTT